MGSITEHKNYKNNIDTRITILTERYNYENEKAAFHRRRANQFGDELIKLRQRLREVK